MVDKQKVSPDLFSDEHDEQTAVAERRRSARESRVAPAWVSESSGSAQGRRTQQQVTVVDLSLHGVGLVSGRAMEVDAAHWIVIATSTLHLSTRFRVVTCRARDDGRWQVGGEFY